MMDRRSFLATLSGCALASFTLPAQIPTKRKPNIIVIFTDDHGFADLQCQGQVGDIKTPNIDRLAAEGIRFTDGYVTAPQCCPSRAGLLTGRYQQRFGLDENGKCPLPLEEKTIADRLKSAGYVTGMVGKWHQEPNVQSVKWAKENPDKAEIKPGGRVKIPWDQILPYYPQNRGFSEFYKGETKRYWANYDLDGNKLAPEGQWEEPGRYRLDVQSDAAVTFIERNHENPFFLYLAYYAPHTPLEATEKYLSRFPGDMPERRRYALAMVSAIDDGVGRILDTLATHNLDKDTLIFFLGDNGAPLKLTKEDSPVNTDAGGWDGSLNNPWVGEKGMLTEGGIRVPFVARWKGTWPEGITYREPVISLDIAATACAAAELDMPPELDGVDISPYVKDEQSGSPHEYLFWRFWTQGAVRKGKWKYVQVGKEQRFLFDLSDRKHENVNVIEAHPEIASELQKALEIWNTSLKYPESLGSAHKNQEERFYDFYYKP